MQRDTSMSLEALHHNVVGCFQLGRSTVIAATCLLIITSLLEIPNQPGNEWPCARNGFPARTRSHSVVEVETSVR